MRKEPYPFVRAILDGAAQSAASNFHHTAEAHQDAEEIKASTAVPG